MQRSYRNNTHLRRQSDVDVVVELTSFPIRDGSKLPDSQKRLLEKKFPEPEYGWRQFRRDVLRAITAGFGESRVREGRKTLKLVMESPEIPVDVVVAVRYLTYAEYSGPRSYKNVEGRAIPADGKQMDRRLPSPTPAKRRRQGESYELVVPPLHKDVQERPRTARGRGPAGAGHSAVVPNRVLVV